VFVRVGNDRDLKGVRLGIHDGQADAVDGDRSFFHRNVAGRGVVLEGIVPTPVRLGNCGAASRLVDMALDDVSVKQGVGAHASFQVDQITFAELSEIGFDQGFADSRHGVMRRFEFDDREADAVVRDALINAQLLCKRSFDREVFIALLFADGNDPSGSFDDT